MGCNMSSAALVQPLRHFTCRWSDSLRCRHFLSPSRCFLLLSHDFMSPQSKLAQRGRREPDRGAAQHAPRATANTLGRGRTNLHPCHDLLRLDSPTVTWADAAKPWLKHWLAIRQIVERACRRSRKLGWYGLCSSQLVL